jgi:hypothetical protein
MYYCIVNIQSAMELTKKFIEATKSEEVRMKIALESGTTFSTLSRWITNNSKLISQKHVLVAINKVTGLKESEILTLNQPA